MRGGSYPYGRLSCWLSQTKWNTFRFHFIDVTLRNVFVGNDGLLYLNGSPNRMKGMAWGVICLVYWWLFDNVYPPEFKLLTNICCAFWYFLSQKLAEVVNTGFAEILFLTYSSNRKKNKITFKLPMLKLIHRLKTARMKIVRLSKYVKSPSALLLFSAASNRAVSRTCVYEPWTSRAKGAEYLDRMNHYFSCVFMTEAVNWNVAFKQNTECFCCWVRGQDLEMLWKYARKFQ